MTFIVFLIDTSPSMNQKTYMGTTLLDVAKGSVESFMKVRAKDINSRGDRYMLLTLEESPCHIKAGFKENNTMVFLNELKNLKPSGLTMMGKALRQTFDILNLARTTSGIDTYGQGRSPNYLEPAVIITVTDGNRFTEASGIRDEMNVPGETIVPGAELTREPFRWDQRLFALCLRIPSHQPVHEHQQMGIVAPDTSFIDSMCDATGGRSYCVTSHRVLQQCIDSLASKIMPGVVIQFEKTGPDPPPIDAKSKTADSIITLERPSTPTPSILPGGQAAWNLSRKMIYVQKSTQKGYSVGHWPIPENFWVDITSTHLRSRPAHPVVKFTCDSCEPMVIENLPFDKYEMEPSPLTQYILERKQPHVCWKVFVENSSKYEGVQYPFGYLKASTKLDCVNLFIMPYDYPKLLPLLEELLKGLKNKPTIAWRQKFDAYVKSMPIYYGPAIRKAFLRMGLVHVLPDGLDNCVNFQVLKYLKSLEQIGKMRANLFSSTPTRMRIQDEDELHSMPVSHMGNYQEYMKHLPPPLRDVEDKPVRQHTFGNPFKLSKNVVIADEADVDPLLIKQQMQSARRYTSNRSLTGMGLPMWANEQGKVRRAMKGPLPRDFSLNKYLEIRSRSSTPTHQSAAANSINSIISNSIQEIETKLLTFKQENRVGEGPVAPTEDSVAAGTESGLEKRLVGKQIKEAAVGAEKGSSAATPNHLLSKTSAAAAKARVIPATGGSSTSDTSVKFEVNNKMAVAGANSTAAGTTHRITWEEMQDEHKRIKKLICREIRKPVLDNEKIFKHLELIGGSVETRSRFIKDIICEAERFKRKSLINKLNSYRRQMFKWYQQHIKSQYSSASSRTGSALPSSSSLSSSSSRKKQKLTNSVHSSDSSSCTSVHNSLSPSSAHGIAAVSNSRQQHSSSTSSAFVTVKKEEPILPQPPAVAAAASLHSVSLPSAAQRKSLTIVSKLEPGLNNAVAAGTVASSAAHYNSIAKSAAASAAALTPIQLARMQAAAAASREQPQLATFNSHHHHVPVAAAARTVVKPR